MKSKPKQKLFIVRKYVMADSCSQALRKERSQKPDDCWLDEDYKKKMSESLTSAIGFNVE